MAEAGKRQGCIYKKVFHYLLAHVKQYPGANFIGLSLINKHKRCISSRVMAPKSNREENNMLARARFAQPSVNI